VKYAGEVFCPGRANLPARGKPVNQSWRINAFPISPIPVLFCPNEWAYGIAGCRLELEKVKILLAHDGWVMEEKGV
jgi:hypothetical protein